MANNSPRGVCEECGGHLVRFCKKDWKTRKTHKKCWLEKKKLFEETAGTEYGKRILAEHQRRQKEIQDAIIAEEKAGGRRRPLRSNDDDGTNQVAFEVRFMSDYMCDMLRAAQEYGTDSKQFHMAQEIVKRLSSDYGPYVVVIAKERTRRRMRGERVT